MGDRFTIRPQSLMIGYIILYGISPFISRLTSATISTYGYLMVLVSTFLLITMNDANDLVNIYIASILPMIGYYLLTYFTTPDELFLWGYKALLFVMPVIIGVYVVYFGREPLDGIKKLIVLSFLVTILTTIIGVVQNPNAARYLATVDQASDAMNVMLGWKNVGGYSFVYTAVLLYPLVVYLYKQRKIPLIVAVLFSGLFFSLAISTEYATSLILVSATSLLYFVKRELKARDLLVIALIIIILLVAFNGRISSFLQYLSGNIGSNTLSDRLLALSGGVSGIENSDDNRIRLYREAVELFIQHPIAGTMFGDKKGLGSHSQILITFAQHGLIGGMMMLFMYRKIYVLFFKPFDNVPGYGFYLWIFIETIILSMVNTGFFIPVIALYAPVLFLAFNEDTIMSNDYGSQ